MAAYVIVDLEITDPEPYRDEYQRRVPATIAQYGGRFLVRGGAHETLEGDRPPKRLVVIEFPSVEQARAWYASPEYQALVPIRARYTRTHFFTVMDGYSA